jgi:DNA repair exonuclease SbcCD nuclease subunit
MIRILHLADLHLGASPAFLGPLAQERRKDYLDAFQRAIDYATQAENEINLVLIVGDLFDTSSPSDDTFEFARRQIARLQQAGIPLVVAPGNHDGIGMPDSVYNKSALNGLMKIIRSPQVEHFESLMVNGEEVHLYGMAWDIQSKAPFDTFTKSERSGYHVAVIHGTLLGSLFSEGHSREVPLDSEKLGMTGMDYVALGHIHKFQEKKVGRTIIVYPGTLEARRFTPGEEGDRFLVVVALERKKLPKVTSLKWNKRDFRSIRLDLDQEAVESDDDLARLISEKYGSSTTALKLTLVGTPPFLPNEDVLQSRLKGEFFWLEIDDQTTTFDGIVMETWAREETIRGLYTRKIRARLELATETEEKQQLELAMKLAAQAFEKTGRR